MLPLRVGHEFVEYIPDDLSANTLYVSIPYATVVHACLCGCGEKVVTPLAPTEWRLGFNGESVSLHPSVGNWSFPCQTHYWIRNGRVEASGRWDREKIEAGRAKDRALKDAYFSRSSDVGPQTAQPDHETRGARSWFRRILGHRHGG